MALPSMLLRRTLNRSLSSISSLTSNTQLLRSTTAASQSPLPHSLKNQISWFRTSIPCSSSRHSSFNDDEKIGPDTILFEGCDYNHWLITMDFPKDPEPTPEQMVETYVQTLAQVVGSVEEAKKRMYACSTTTYRGFQAVMTEEMSEKFRGLPGVVFILPDSYIDPVNKEYGGDKYDNGVITHRPPPVQYGRQSKYSGQRGPRETRPVQQGGQWNDRQDPPRGGDGRNPGVQQQYRQPQNFGPSPSVRGDGRNPGEQQQYGQPQNFGPSSSVRGDGSNPGSQQNYGPPQHGGQTFNTRGDGRNYVPQQNYSQPQNVGPNPVIRETARSFEPQQNYAPQQSYPLPTGNNNYGPGGNNTYPTERDPIPPYQRGSSQVGGRDYSQLDNRDFRGENRNVGSSYDGNYRQGPGTGFTQMEHRDNMQGQQNFTPMGHTRNDQGGY
ncbi:hypothetical protein ACHQM5_017518 [Ranunculus cassubicifolius]